MRKPHVRQPSDHTSPSAALADYFWIAGLDGEELFNSYARLAPPPSRRASYGLENAIPEHTAIDRDSTHNPRRSIQSSQNGARNSYQRLSRLSDEARLSLLSLDDKLSNRISSRASNQSNATVRLVQPAESRNSVLYNDADFEKSLSKFATDREKFYLDLSFKAPRVQPSPSPARPRAQKIVAEEIHAAPSRGMGSIRRHMSFREMNSVKRQPSLARNVSTHTSRRMSSYNSVIPLPEALHEQSDVHPLKRKFEPVLLDRYPRKGSVEGSARQIPFPEFVPMFAFPNDIQVVSSETRPRSSWHGFSMTAADSSRIHALGIIFWIPMSQKTANELDRRCEEWRRANLSEAESELAHSLLGRLASERAKLSQLLAELPYAPSGTHDRDELEEEIGTVEERINMMSEMLKPLHQGSTSQIEGLANGQTGLWVPRAYGLLGREGSLSGLWKDWLRAITVPMSDGAILRVPASSPRVGMWQPLEKYVQELCIDAPGLMSSRTQVELMIRDLRLYARKEAPNELPGSRTTDLYPLFRALSIPSILILFEYLLADSRIILLSSHTSMLQLASKALIELLWPLQWTGIYIPVLPARLVQAIEAPCPYICGVDRRYEKMEFPDDDYVLVDLDKDEIRSTSPPFSLPKQQRRKLQSLLYLAAPHHHSRGVPTGPPAYVIESFPSDSFPSEHSNLYSAIHRSTNLAKLNSINSTSFGAQGASDMHPQPPIFNAFLQAGSTRGRSADRPRTSSTGKTSIPDADQHSTISNNYPPVPGTPMSRNDSGFALQASLREKRSGHFDSFKSRRNDSFSNANPRRPSLPFVKHSSSPSTLTTSHLRPPAPSTYAPSTYAQSTLAASTIMPGFAPQAAENTETTTWVEGHCLEMQSARSTSRSSGSGLHRTHCAICDQPPDDCSFDNYRCTGCGITVHSRCANPQTITLPCPAAFYPDQVRAAFVRCLAGLLYTYKKYMMPLTSFEEKQRHPGLSRKLDLQNWIRSLPGEQSLYVEMLGGTQMFCEWIAEHEIDPRSQSEEVKCRNALFDAIIAAKRTRGGRFGVGLRSGSMALGRRIFSPSTSSGWGPGGSMTDVLNDTSEHIWRTVSVGGASDHKLDYGPNAMKGRDYHEVVTRVPAKLEDGFFVKPRKVTAGDQRRGGGERGTRHRLNGLSMHAP